MKLGTRARADGLFDSTCLSGSMSIDHLEKSSESQVGVFRLRQRQGLREWGNYPRNLDYAIHHFQFGRETFSQIYHVKPTLEEAVNIVEEIQSDTGLLS